MMSVWCSLVGDGECGRAGGGGGGVSTEGGDMRGIYRGKARRLAKALVATCGCKYFLF